MGAHNRTPRSINPYSLRSRAVMSFLAQVSCVFMAALSPLPCCTAIKTRVGNFVNSENAFYNAKNWGIAHG